MIALPAGDDIAALALAALHEILSRELKRRLDRFRAATDEEDMPDAFGRVCDEIVGQLFGDIGCEEARVSIGECIELHAHGSEDVRMRMPETRHRRPARSVDVLLSSAVADDDPGAARRAGIGMPGLAMENVTHCDVRRWRSRLQAIALRRWTPETEEIGVIGIA